ncbi:hypothetical protein [Thaumasiovibrio subtropicus]|uniref:hypothetical protein n=1 Tax=Thaumasiovibrio subtropicus TaxID=1891207 RepID=UPI000B34B56F|nr:hypothetical protein [Thaumasiovibrio subtropicus]
MFKNKHFIIALLIAPILAIIAYFGTDMAVSEKPQAAQEGETYKLVSKSNCRYTSGLCSMENGDFKIQFRSEGLTQHALDLSLKTEFPLDGVKVALASSPEAKATPTDMLRSDESGQHWHLTLAAPSSEQDELRVVISANNTLYYGETSTEFVVYETLFTEK